MTRAIEPLKSFKIIKKRSNPATIPLKGAERISDLGNPAAWLLDLFSGVRSLSGEVSTHDTAMQLDSYYAAIRNISEDIAKLPFNIFQIVENGRKLVTNQPAQQLLHNYANPNMSTMDLMQTLIHWAISFGNGYAEIVRNGKGQAKELWPIHPSRIKPFFDRNQKLFYDVHATVTTIQGQQPRFIRVPQENIFNLRGLGADGIVGYSVFALAAESIGQGLAVQKFASVYFNNGAALSGLLLAPGKLDQKAYNNLRESWGKQHEGSAKNKHKIAIIEGGMKFEPTSSTAQETQMLESQKFTVERMARLLRIPQHKIGHAGGLVKANFEAESISYFRDTLTPWIRRISLETDRKIIMNPRFTATYQVDALTLGDSKTRAGVFKTHRNMGTMSINDVLRLENQNVIEEPWADEYHMQSNITTVKNISEGANLKPNGQNGNAKLEPGEKDEEGRDPEAAEAIAPLVEVDALTMLADAKVAHMPNFKYTAHRLVNKESMMLEKKLKSFINDETGFQKWAEHFFDKQKAELIEVFEPCCKVFVNTFKADGVEINMDFLSKFSDNYGEDGKTKVAETFKKVAIGQLVDEDIDKDAEKLANSVMNMLCK